MKIHSDTLTREDLFRALPSGCHLEATQKGSRKRARAFDVHMSANPGTDKHGIDRCYSANTGKFGGPRNEWSKAATYVEWGDWMVELLKIDPAAIVGQYDDAADFVAQTTSMAPYRQKRENAPEHARRWAEELQAVAA